MIETKRVPGVPDEEGAFSARVYVVEGPPDADGDVILRGAIEDGARVVVSAVGHDVLAEGAEPAGDARLYHGGNAVVAIGRAFASERGRVLRQKVREPGVEWSVGYQVLEARPPTREERARHPATRRIIVKWRVDEISPVTAGSCGPACATLVSKAATCGGPCCADETREAALKELARFEHTRYRIRLSDVKHRKAQWDAEAAAERARDATDAEQAILEAHEVKSLDVPVELRVVAAAALERASEVLGGPRPPVRWFSPAAISAMKAVGMWLQGHIWLAVVTDPEELYNTVAHEVHHALKGSDETAATTFAERLSLLRHAELHVGPRAQFEDRVEWGKSDARWRGTYLAPPSPRLQLVAGLRAGALVVDAGTVYERTEDDTWCRVADLIPR